MAENDGHVLAGSLIGPTDPPLLQFFSYEHLPAELQSVSAPFAALARLLADILPRNAESTTALRKLLEAKDCAVRSVIYKL